MVVKNLDTLLEKLITELEKNQTKPEQNGRKNNIEISGISHEILVNNLEDKVIDICKDVGIEIGHMGIESCHRLPLGGNKAGSTKRVKVKFAYRKHSEDMLRLKRIIGFHSKVFGKCKGLQRIGVINQVFCLGADVTIKVSQNGPPVKIHHENDLKVYQGEGNASDSE